MTRRVANPPNPWRSEHVDYLGDPPDAELEIYEEEASSILSENDSADVPFRWSVNPYRGCFHACAYCYARPTHQYLGWGAGTDFDRRIVVKTNAAELLAQALQRPGWHRELLAFSGVTDCYQPIEASYGLTRRCLEMCLRLANPVAVVTKGALVERDAELLAAIHRRADARVFVSLPFADEALARRIEPQAASPARRLAALSRLSDCGVPTGIAIAPVIPGLNDDQIPALLQAARAAGATRAFMILLRLPGEVATVFEERLREAAPLRVERVLHTLRSMREGRLNGSRAGSGGRMSGSGARWQAVQSLFDLHCRRLGLEIGERNRYGIGAGPRQGSLFEPPPRESSD